MREPGRRVPCPKSSPLGEPRDDVVARAPRPDEAPTTTIARTMTIPWLAASSSARRDSGSWTFQSSWRAVEPAEVAASTTCGETDRMPTSTSRMTGGTA